MSGLRQCAVDRLGDVAIAIRRYGNQYPTVGERVVKRRGPDAGRTNGSACNLTPAASVYRFASEQEIIVPRHEIVEAAHLAPLFAVVAPQQGCHRRPVVRPLLKNDPGDVNAVGVRAGEMESAVFVGPASPRAVSVKELDAEAGAGVPRPSEMNLLASVATV